MEKVITEYSQISVNNIFEKIEKGELKVPDFQRAYVWERDNIINFLNSIYGGEPFGNIIIWKDENCSLKSIKEINPIFKNYASSGGCSNLYLLDGQQRLTTLYVIKTYEQINEDLKNNDDKLEYQEIKKIFKKFEQIYFDLNLEKFIYLKKDDAKNKAVLKISDIISIWKADYDKSIYIKDAAKFINDELCVENNGFKVWYNNFDGNSISFIRNILEYIFSKVNVPKTEISSCDFDKAVDIFNNINTSGVKLTPYEIIKSKWMKYNIDINEYINKIKSSFDIDFKELKNEVLIDSLYLLIDKNPILSKKDKILYNIENVNPLFNKDNYINQYKKINTTNEKLEFILKIFKIVSVKSISLLYDLSLSCRYLPSSNIIKWVIYMFWHNKNKDMRYDANIKRYIRRYIALISLNQLYKNATEKQLERDFKFTKIVNNGDIKLLKDYLNPDSEDKASYINDWSWTQSDILDTKYKKNDTSSKSRFIYNIISMSSFDLIDASKPRKNEINLHHIFPWSAVDKKTSKKYYVLYEKNINSLANIMPITGASNKWINNREPSDYYNEIKSKNNIEIDELLKKSFIEIKYIRTNDFFNFILDRSRRIAEYINNEIM